MAHSVAVLTARELDGIALFDHAPFQSSPHWWRTVADTALSQRECARFLLASGDDGPELLLPVTSGGSGGQRAFVTPYTCLYQPPADETSDLEGAAAAIAARLGPVLQIDGIDPEWLAWSRLLAGFRRAGFVGCRFDSFVNWREPLHGRDWRAYLADRPGALRETIRRKLRQAERDPAVVIQIADRGETGAFLADYEEVYARSWKEPEPFPSFAASFVAEASAAGVLRLAVLRRDGVPLAAQYWTVERSHATLLKLVHVEDARKESPGTVLTAWMMRRLIEEENVTALDFGRGDDPYKRLWATERRTRGGILLANWRHPAGLTTLLQQSAGTLIRKRHG